MSKGVRTALASRTGELGCAELGPERCKHGWDYDMLVDVYALSAYVHDISNKRTYCVKCICVIG